jgi:protein SCO1/2
MPKSRTLLFAAACIAIAAALALVTVVVVQGRSGAPTVTSTGQPDVGGAFQLVDQDGRTVDQTLLDGRWSVVFFGFTHCPDYCPTTLQTLAATKAQMGAEGEALQVIFITVDPTRDTPEALKDYLLTSSFPPGVIGLTGSEAQVAEAARVYRAHYDRVEAGGTYTMNHTLTVYLMGPDGQFRAALAHNLGPERSAQVIQDAMAAG